MFSVQELAQMLGARLIGPSDIVVRDVRSMESAGPHDLAFLRNPRDRRTAESSNAGALITPVELKAYAGAQLVCDDAELAMVRVLEAVAAQSGAPPAGVSPRASVSAEAELGQGVSVADFAVIGEGTTIGDGAVIGAGAYIGCHCRIGPRTVIHANVSVHDGVTIGADCIIHYNSVIGGEGFGFLQRDGRNVKVPQVGTVVIGDRVEIGALTTIDRATLEATIIGDGTKIDNHCHVAHNCRIGPDCIMAGASKLAGSVVLGRGVIVAEDVGVTDHVTVGDGAILGGRSGVHTNVAPGEIVLGMPSRPAALQRRIWALQSRLPQLADRLRAVEKKLEELVRRAGESAC